MVNGKIFTLSHVFTNSLTSTHWSEMMYMFCCFAVCKVHLGAELFAVLRMRYLSTLYCLDYYYWCYHYHCYY